MGRGALTDQMDVASLVFTLFMLFFVGLIAWLHRESKREGYPLVNGRHEPVSTGLFGMPSQKSYRIADGTTMIAPHGRDAVAPTLPAQSLTTNEGYPIVPFSSSAWLGIGPGAYTERRDVPDVTFEGKPRLIPMRSARHFTVAAQDLDLRGAAIFGADGLEAGKVMDIWVDLSETCIRYLEVDLPGPEIAGQGNVLVPMNTVDIDKTNGTLHVYAITAAQFNDVPRTKAADRVTLREEDRVMAYYGGGYLYAVPGRGEPLV